MMNCPKCGQAGHTRSSHSASTTTKERYYQCQNINCGSTFITLETFVRYIARPELVFAAPPHPTSDGQETFIFEA
ncbi:ogr/Delta-like zinc finger family protein [Buttiauxella brennerae]|uniref:ogr/Delta-like zinc finger family protein n=1 Tax=Buttiauxella brennerae TaxID=82988 RepID=UPI0009443497|nr:ogr/Delta-like zinc finger family protein [Buttiauxella brennerae]